MTDFFTRLAQRTLGLVPTVRPLVASMFAADNGPETDLLEVIEETSTELTRVEAWFRGASVQAPERIPVANEHQSTRGEQGNEKHEVKKVEASQQTASAQAPEAVRQMVAQDGETGLAPVREQEAYAERADHSILPTGFQTGTTPISPLEPKLVTRESDGPPAPESTRSGNELLPMKDEEGGEKHEVREVDVSQQVASAQAPGVAHQMVAQDGGTGLAPNTVNLSDFALQQDRRKARSLQDAAPEFPLLELREQEAYAERTDHSILSTGFQIGATPISPLEPKPVTRKSDGPPAPESTRSANEPLLMREEQGSEKHEVREVEVSLQAASAEVPGAAHQMVAQDGGAGLVPNTVNLSDFALQQDRRKARSLQDAAPEFPLLELREQEAYAERTDHNVLPTGFQIGDVEEGLVPLLRPPTQPGSTSLVSDLPGADSLLEERHVETIDDKQERQPGSSVVEPVANAIRPTIPGLGVYQQSATRNPVLRASASKMLREILVGDDLPAQEQQLLSSIPSHKFSVANREAIAPSIGQARRPGGEERALSRSETQVMAIQHLESEAPMPMPTIQVTIGRVEVRAMSAPKSNGQIQQQRSASPAMGLDEYLRRQEQGGRR